MPPKTKMTREEVAVDLAERGIKVVNSTTRTKRTNRKEYEKAVDAMVTHLTNEFER